MAAAGPWVLYNDFKLNAFKKLMDLSADSFKLALVTSASTAISATLTPATYAGFNNEVSNANGYTTGGAAAGSPTLTGGGATATITFDLADVPWTASASGITARAAVLYDDTATSKNLIAYCLLDSTPADVVVAAGNTLTVQITNVFTDA
jgi:hypothetical protein